MEYLIPSIAIVGFLLISIGIIKDRTSSFDNGSFAIEVSAIALGIICLLVAGMATIILLLEPKRAEAHDHGRPQLNDWYKSLHSGKGPCCDGSDFSNGTAMTLDDPDWENTSGHYRARIKGEWVDIDDSAVLNEPNVDGRPIVWFYYVDGHPKARCFMPGTMG